MIWAMFVVSTPLSHLLPRCCLPTKAAPAGSVKRSCNLLAQSLPSPLVSLLSFNRIRLASVPDKLAGSVEGK